MNTNTVIDSKSTLNLLERNKKISQLIAYSWLPGGEHIEEQLCGSEEQVLNLLVAENILNETEAKFAHVKVDLNPPGPPYVGSISDGPPPHLLILSIPYPQRPTEVTNEELRTWVNSELVSEPFSPFEINRWIPYTC